MALPSAITKISDTIWELPKTYKEGMRVPARIYATEKLLNEMDAGVFDQVCNVACLPGILNYACCMPDGHWGYGFPIGGVAAMDPGGRSHLAGRNRLRHQLRHAARPDEPDAGRGPAPSAHTGGPAVPSRAHRRRQPRFRETEPGGIPYRRRAGFALVPETWLRLARGPGADRRGRLLSGRRCLQDNR